MYIPFSYFGNSCTGSGYGYTYWNNDATIADNVTWISLCNNVGQSANILPSSSYQIAATSAGVSGIAANTSRVDAIWNITGSANQLIAKNYAISGSSTNRQVFSWIRNDGQLVTGNSTDNPNVQSYIIPILLSTQTGTITNNPITDNGFAFGTNIPPSQVNKGLLTTYNITLSTTGSAVMGIGPDGKYFSYLTAPSSSVTLRIISSTIPVPVTGSRYNRISNMNNTSGLIESRSCYNYEVQGTAGRTGSYLDCTNQSASITFDGTLQNICAAANSLKFENATGATYTINSIGYGSCTGSTTTTTTTTTTTSTPGTTYDKCNCLSYQFTAGNFRGQTYTAYNIMNCGSTSSGSIALNNAQQITLCLVSQSVPYFGLTGIGSNITYLGTCTTASCP